MGLETGTFINDLVATNPTSTDKVRVGDDHIRLLKSTILATFPNITGAVTPTHTELNYVDGVTSAIQTQLDAKLAIATADGAGLTESGGVLAVGAGTGIAVNADDVAIDISGLTAIEGNAIAPAADGYLVNDAGTPKLLQHSDAGLPVTTEATTNRTIATADMVTYIEFTSSSASTVTLNTGVGKKGNFFVVERAGTGALTTAGTATVRSANGTTLASRYSVAVFFCTATDTWTVFGDTL